VDIFVAAVIGVAGGTLGGMMGVGGGIIMVPALALLLDQDQHTAQGLALGAMVAMAITGSVLHYRQGTLDPGHVVWIAPGAVLFGVLGGYLAGLLGADELARMFGGLVLVMAVRLLWPQRRSVGVIAAPAMREGSHSGISTGDAV
jgi:uncharacterized membrane protein YfcA